MNLLNSKTLPRLKRLPTFFIPCLFLFSTQLVQAQTVEVIKWSKYKSISQGHDKNDDTTYVINFWATWCAPCVEELPYFISAKESLAGKKVKFIFISLDGKRQLSKVNNFELLPQMQNVYLLDEPNYNSWIDKVSEAWGGSIPATLIVNRKQDVYQFYEQQFSEDELLNTINKVLK